jgi:magnesium transporter
VQQKPKHSSYRYRKSLIKNVSQSDNPQIECFIIDEKEIKKQIMKTPEELGSLKKEDKRVVWIKIVGKINSATLEAIHKIFIIDKAYLEEILDRVHKPKAENFENFHLITLKAILDNQDSNESIKFNPICLYLERNFVVSFSEFEDKLYTEAINKLDLSHSKKIEVTSSHIYHRIIDCVFDEFYELTGMLSQQIDYLNIDLSMKETDFIPRLLRLKNNVIIVKREMLPMKESLGALVKSDEKTIDSLAKKNIRHTYENARELYESMEHFKELLDNFTNLYRAKINFNTNNVFKELTIFAAIFAPITFLAGVYGMNFKHMPELEWKYSYLGIWLVFISVSLFTLTYFRRKKWI